MTLFSDLNAALPGLVVSAEDKNNCVFTRSLTTQEWATAFAIIDPVAARKERARGAAAAIPDWATYTEAQALQWLLDHIGTPLATPIPPNPMTNVQIRAVLVNIVAVMNDQYIAEKAMARMVVALRNEEWPNLEG